MRGRGRNFLDNGADACLEGICKRLKFRFTALAGFFVGSGAFNLGLFLCISPVFVALPLMQPVLYFRLAILLLKSFVLDHVHFEYVDRARHITNLIAPSRAWNLDFLITVHQLVHLATNTMKWMRDNKTKQGFDEQSQNNNHTRRDEACHHLFFGIMCRRSTENVAILRRVFDQYFKRFPDSRFVNGKVRPQTCDDHRIAFYGLDRADPINAGKVL